MSNNQDQQPLDRNRNQQQPAEHPSSAMRTFIMICRRVIEIEAGGVEVLSLMEEVGRGFLAVWENAARVYNLYQQYRTYQRGIQGPAVVHQVGGDGGVL